MSDPQDPIVLAERLEARNRTYTADNGCSMADLDEAAQALRSLSLQVEGLKAERDLWKTTAQDGVIECDDFEERAEKAEAEVATVTALWHGMSAACTREHQRAEAAEAERDEAIASDMRQIAKTAIAESLTSSGAVVIGELREALIEADGAWCDFAILLLHADHDKCVLAKKGLHEWRAKREAALSRSEELGSAGVSVPCPQMDTPEPRSDGKGRVMTERLLPGDGRWSDPGFLWDLWEHFHLWDDRPDLDPDFKAANEQFRSRAKQFLEEAGAKLYARKVQ